VPTANLADNFTVDAMLRFLSVLPPDVESHFGPNPNKP